MRATNPRKAMKCGIYHTRVLVAVYLFFMETRKCSFLQINKIIGFSDEEKERQKQEALVKILKNQELTVYLKAEQILILFEQL